MPDAPEIAADARCWQCGAPANPACTFRQKLSIRTPPRGDAQGFPVVRGRRFDSVSVPVPRCARCQDRNLITAVVLVCGFLGGGLVSGLAFPSRGWTTIVGGFLPVIVLAVASHWRERRRGRQPIGSYPPILRLRAAGWSDPE